MIKRDGFTIIDQGVDSGNAPETIGRRKLAWAVNCSLRGLFPKSRPSFVKRTLQFANQQDQAHATQALFQGAGAFLPRLSEDKLLILAVAGRVFAISPMSNYTVRDISIAGDLNYSTVPKVWMTQAEDFLIIQDGLSKAFINDGANSFRPVLDRQVPTGTSMGYVNGRLWITTVDGHGFIGSDLVGSSSGTTAYRKRDAVLWFTENTFLNGGFAFSTPTNAGPIRAMSSFGQIDSSLGQGPMQVLTTKGGFSVNAPPDRTTWQDLQFPIQTISMVGDGAVSQESTVVINGDIWFRGQNGVRSFQIARRDVTQWANTPMSFEMNRVLGQDDLNLLPWCSAAHHDNRLLMCCAPKRVPGRGVAWQGLSVLDFAPVSGIGANTNPIWEGLWTGLDILQVVELEDRCFAFVVNRDTQDIELWEILSEEKSLSLGRDKDGTVRIRSRIESTMLNFQSGADLFELAEGSAWVDSVVGTVDFVISFKSDGNPNWQPWSTWTENAKSGICPPTCPPSPPYIAQIRPAMQFGNAPDSCDSQNQRPTRLNTLGYAFQVALDITGPFTLKRIIITADTQKEVPEPCRGTAPTDLTGITLCYNPFSYNSNA